MYLLNRIILDDGNNNGTCNNVSGDLFKFFMIFMNPVRGWQFHIVIIDYIFHLTTFINMYQYCLKKFYF